MFELLVATIIFCPINHEPIYKYKHDLFGDLSGLSVKAKDFEVIGNATVPIDGMAECDPKCSGVPVTGYCYWAWKEKRNMPAFPYSGFTFLVKDKEGNFTWRPYDITEDLIP